MSTDLAVQTADRDIALAHEEEGMAALAHVLGSGDLAQLTNAQRVGHYLRLCRSLGLNELSRPFDWIYFKGGENEPEKLALYPNQSCTAQLRRQHHMRIRITRRDVVGDLFVCEAQAFTPDGREDTSSKYVPIVGRFGRFKGNQLANAMMKAETGAKRRVTLSMIGLASPPDQDEAASWRPVTVDGTGQVIDSPTEEQKALAADPKMARSLGEPVFEDAEIDEEDGAVSQAARPEELETPRREGPRPSFKPSDEQIASWRGRWFANVKGTSLDSDEARARFVAGWTRDELEWPKAKQTDSLPTMLKRMTADEAASLLAHVQALCDGERREMLQDAEAARGEPQTRHADDKVHQSVMLTGGPAEGDSEPAF